MPRCCSSVLHPQCCKQHKAKPEPEGTFPNCRVGTSATQLAAAFADLPAAVQGALAELPSSQALLSHVRWHHCQVTLLNSSSPPAAAIAITVLREREFLLHKILE